MSWTVPLVIALVSDAIDYLLAPLLAVPVAGWFTYEIINDMVDIVTVALLYRYIGHYALISAGELIPVADFLPLHTASVLMWRYVHGSVHLGER